MASTLPASVRVAIGFTAGVALVQGLPELPPPWWALLPGLLVPLAVAGRRPLIAGFLAGLLGAGVHGAIRLQDRLPSPERLQAVVEGRVLSLPEAMDRGVRFDFGIDRVLQPEGLSLPRKVRVSWYEIAAPPRAGEIWRLRLSLRRPRGMQNPGGFDYEEWLFAEGIRAVGYVRESQENRRLAEAPAFSARTWRQNLNDRLSEVLAGSPVAGLIRALTIGADDGIDRDQWEVLRRTGTAHLIAISGSHIGLIAGAAFFLVLRGCARAGLQRFSPPAVAAVAGGLVALFYSALADFAIPTRRAMIMIAVAMGAIILRRNLDPFHVLAAAVLAVLAYDPLAVLAPGFWLSFGAVALIAFALAGRAGRAGGVLALVKINWATALGLAPLLLLFFRQVSLVSPVANLIAVPVLGTLLIPVCLGGALLLPLWPPAGVVLLHLAAAILGWFWPVLEWLSAWPLAQWTQADPPTWTLPLAGLGVLLLLAPRGIPSRWLGLVLLLPAFTYTPPRLAPGAFRLQLLDVGQGLAAVVETRHKVLVFDTGPRLGPNFDMGSAVIEPYLRHRGLDHIDVLVVSHGDDDHIGGARSLLRRLPVATFYTGAPEKLREFPATPCTAGQNWTWDGVAFAMLGPVAPSRKENDNSCVLRVQGSGGAALLTGDIEAAGETLLVNRYGTALRSELLVAPHHGSNTSSTPALLGAVSPARVLIPAGPLNRFGFPHPAVVQRYRNLGVEPLTTGDTGAITAVFGSQPGPPAISGYRAEHRRYWQEPLH